MPSDLTANGFDLFVSKRPGSDDQNIIQPYNDSVALTIVAASGQTSSFLDIVSESSVSLFSVTPTGTFIDGDIGDGTSLTLYASPYSDTGSYALKVFNNAGTTSYFSISENSGSLTTYIKNLTVDYSSDILFSNLLK